MIRAIFSANEINVSLPKCWRDLDDDELRMVYAVMAVHGPHVDCRHIIFMSLAGIEKLPTSEKVGADWRYLIKGQDLSGRKAERSIELQPEWEASCLDSLSWLNEPGCVPVRFAEMRGCKAIDARFHDLPFGDYLMIENLYQGYLQSKNTMALARAARFLYPGFDDDCLRGSETLNILNWLVQVKNLFSAHFPHFFQPGDADGEGESTMEDVYNNQIRALTGGDITKEEQIKGIDCWRALTELDFKAKEAEDFRREQSKQI